MPSLVEQMLGEFTGVGSVAPATAMPVATVATVATPNAAKERLRRLRKRRGDPRGLREATQDPEDRPDSLIPDEAREVDIRSGLPDEMMTAASLAGDDEEIDLDAPVNGDLLEPSLALVAPDCTPNGTKPLTPAQVPAASAPLGAASATAQAPSTPHLVAPTPSKRDSESASGLLSLLIKPTPPAVPLPTVPGNTVGESMAVNLPGIPAIPGLGVGPIADIHAPLPPPKGMPTVTGARSMMSRINFRE